VTYDVGDNNMKGSRGHIKQPQNLSHSYTHEVLSLLVKIMH